MNKYRYLRAGAAVIIGILSVSAFAGLFYPLKIFDFQLTALLQRVLVDFSLFAVILAAALVFFTFLFGRIYCSVLCPLGLYQEFLMLLFRRRTGFRPNRPYKYFLAALVFGALIGGTAVLVRLIDPYTLFGRRRCLARSLHISSAGCSRLVQRTSLLQQHLPCRRCFRHNIQTRR